MGELYAKLRKVTAINVRTPENLGDDVHKSLNFNWWEKSEPSRMEIWSYTPPKDYKRGAYRGGKSQIKTPLDEETGDIKEKRLYVQILLLPIALKFVTATLAISSTLLIGHHHASAKSVDDGFTLRAKYTELDRLSVLALHTAEVRPSTAAFPSFAGYSLARADKRGRMKDADKGRVRTYDSGLEGATHSIVVSGLPGGPTMGGPASIEFAIAPIENDTPSYDKAVFVKSDGQGKYKLSLPPGKYWVGAKAKALDPVNYSPGPFSFSENVIVLKQGVFSQLDLFEIGYAP